MRSLRTIEKKQAARLNAHLKRGRGPTRLVTMRATGPRAEIDCDQRHSCRIYVGCEVDDDDAVFVLRANVRVVGGCGVVRAAITGVDTTTEDIHVEVAAVHHRHAMATRSFRLLTQQTMPPEDWSISNRWAAFEIVFMGADSPVHIDWDVEVCGAVPWSTRARNPLLLHISPSR